MRTATDWDQYYASVPPTAKLTRRYTTSVLLDAIRRFATPGSASSGLSVVEIGGANSCFLDPILDNVRCSSYDIIDTNAYGLSLTSRESRPSVIGLHNESVLDLSVKKSADLVLSVGLIEHFEPAETRQAVQAHLDLLRPGGTAIITYPTPTLLYRATRKLIEVAGQWKFPDERPLQFEEVAGAFKGMAETVYTKVLWPLLLTQQLVVLRKP